MSYVAEEGLRLRLSHGVIRWICSSCNHIMTFLTDGACANCKVRGTLHEIKTPERLHDETEAMKDKQRFHYWQADAFNPQSSESQTGDWLTPEQVLQIIQRWIPGAKTIQQFNPFLGRMLTAFYVPHHWKPEETQLVSPTERKGNLKFICCGEIGMMREWDLLPLDEQGRSLPYERGWRGVLAIFYRSGLIPFVPDDGRRLGWWQIKESPYRRENG